MGGIDTAEGRPGDAIERYKVFAAGRDAKQSFVTLMTA
jgi:hypothetical protein